MEDTTEHDAPTHKSTSVHPRRQGFLEYARTHRVAMAFFAILALGFMAAAVLYGVVYAVSPSNIRQPEPAHYHMRLQVIVDGKAVNFSQPPYQVSYVKDQCTVQLTPEPIHFHDQKDQFVHIHWQGVTGGQVLKYYGWNEIGGLDDTLGYRLDAAGLPQRVPIHGDVLPNRPADSQFFIYTGDQGDFQARDVQAFLFRDIEAFFGKSYDIPTVASRGWLHTQMFAPAKAHDGETHTTSVNGGSETEEERLTRINSLVGNVVVFVQQTEPTREEIAARFDNLVPLGESSCGG